MPHLPPRDALGTHNVSNQPEAVLAKNLWADDAVLQTYAPLSSGDTAHLAGFGRTIGAQDVMQAGQAANRYPPELILFDPGGRRLDEVRFHPAYHTLMQVGIGAGYAALPWEGAAGGHVTHAAMVYMMTQVEPGVCCPMTMTYAALPAVAADSGLEAVWVSKLISRIYDASIRPVIEKTGATLGMAMTEKQGGSDVRANTTKATRDGDHYRLNGHKWFCSAPMSDGFLTLAQADGGLTCFLVPRWLEDARNGIEIQRLKDKLGNRANASSEIEYVNALAFRLGDEGAGVRTILEMVHHTRLDTAMAPAGLMRAALAHAAHWARHRMVFQKTLIDQPLMQSVLADLMLDWEGALALGLYVAGFFDKTDEEARKFSRLAVALAKFLNNKLCPGLVYEAMECLGGMGYVEDTGMPLIYREAPLNSIWEGSGNVICLDVLRTLAKAPMSGEVLQSELAAATGQYRGYDAALRAHMDRFGNTHEEANARWFVESLATLLTASVLIRQAPSEVSAAYVATRVVGERGRTAGAINGLDTRSLLSRL
ncbi:MAG: acyl-CoA dehydrogenase family protein [Pseudomonadota bacterium]